jgi:hypothetical protein
LKELEKIDFGTDAVFESLYGKKLQIDIAEYTYVIELFKQASQNNKGQNQGTSLG